MDLIEAKDSNGPESRYARTLLEIEIRDVNDNAPSLFVNIIAKSDNQTGRGGGNFYQKRTSTTLSIIFFYIIQRFDCSF